MRDGLLDEHLGVMTESFVDEKLHEDILDWCERTVNNQTTKYTKVDFTNDLRLTINKHLKMNALDVDLITLCLLYLDAQDPEACKKFALDILEKEQSQSPGCSWLLDNEIREDIYDFLDNDDRLDALIIDKINDPHSECDLNLDFVFKDAHSKNIAHPLLVRILNNPKLNWGNLLEKLEMICPGAPAESGYPSFNDCLNIICRQFDSSQNSVIEKKMARCVIQRQKSEKPDLDKIPEGEYKDWLKYIASLPATAFRADRH